MTPKWYPNWAPTWLSKMMPTWLYRQNFTKFSLNRHYNGYSLYILPQSRQVASGKWLIGVKTRLTADFRIIKDMDCSLDKIEVIKQNLWKHGKRFNIFTIYSTSNNKPDFSYLNSLTRTVFLEEFNAHFPI
ncbi:hypothetical protein TNCV_1612291 [Trichonephila clavipes]|nr:hypothetical protein TNCV_1612291 [Trichonephila clavipes]